MKSGLIALLTGESSVSAICGDRVYVNRAPEKAALPNVIITQISAEHNTTLDGLSNNLRFVDFDIDCRAERSVTAESLAHAIRTFIDDYSGTAGEESIGAVIINDESDSYDSPVDGSDVGVYLVTLDVTVQYNP